MAFHIFPKHQKLVQPDCAVLDTAASNLPSSQSSSDANNAADESQNLRFTRELWISCFKLIKPFWVSEKKKTALSLLAILLVLLFAVNGLSVGINFISGAFMTALQEKNSAVFYRMLWTYFSIFVVGTPIVAFYSYVQDRLGMKWREWMTNHLIDKYFKNRKYYHINNSSAIDNPDERIAQDVNSFCKSALSFTLVIIGSVITFCSFIVILWNISSPLVFIVLAYATVGTLATYAIGRRLMGINFNQLKREANFRYSLIHIRNNTESIAFYRGEEREKEQVKRRFADAIWNFNLLIGWTRNLGFVTTSYNYLIVIIPALIIAPIYFAGKVKFGAFTQADMAFSQILSALSIAVTSFADLSSFAAETKRLSAFSEALDLPEQLSTPGSTLIKTGITESQATSETNVTVDTRSDLNFANVVTAKVAEFAQHSIIGNVGRIGELGGLGEVGGTGQITEFGHMAEGRGITLENVTLLTPNCERIIVKDLSVEIKAGSGLLIVGPSGSGKSSLLRAIAGIWIAGQGEIKRPELSELMFLPQKPYLILGTLREQLLYPLNHKDVSDDELNTVLDLVNLNELPERIGGFDHEVNFGDILSLGEQQRLAFARLFLAKPRYAILDEATSALDVRNEAHLYKILQSTSTTVISVGHRPTLVKFHPTVLELQGDTDWRFMATSDYLAANRESLHVTDYPNEAMNSAILEPANNQHSKEHIEQVLQTLSESIATVSNDEALYLDPIASIVPSPNKKRNDLVVASTNQVGIE